jgi:hypothetical protein
MPKSVRSFGHYLRQFVRSVDIVDKRTLDDVRDLVHDYVRTELEIGFFTLATRTTVDGELALQSQWRTEGAEVTTRVRTPEGAYNAQITLSFGTRRPLWVVNPDQKELDSSDTYREMWSGVQNLPRYQAPTGRRMKTSIVVPMTHFDSAIGVIYLESTRYLEFTDVAAEELQILADSLAVLFDLRSANIAQVTGTLDAIKELRDVLRDTTFPLLTKPQLFLASSGRADDAARGIIELVLDEFSDTMTIVKWDQIDDSGSITQRLIEEISRSRFGLCYLSEPAVDDHRHGFRDNPNVLFEAGMLHALTNAPAAQPRGWVPIREVDSPDVPFDFASERILRVPRTDAGDLMEARFRELVRRRVRALLEDALG